MSKSSVARKLAEEYVNVLKYNPELTHDEKILSLELRLDKLIEDVEKGCAEAQQRQETAKVVETKQPRNGLFLHPSEDWGAAIVSENPNEQELTFGQFVKQKSPGN